jgi:prolyl-tRNA synthetase
MGCYGIGIGRTVAACIEQNNDANGIIFPIPIAPFQCIVSSLNVKDDAVRTAAEDIYFRLIEEGVEVLLDDRDERPGFKFKDADLIGIPLRIVVGGKNLAEGKVELKERRSGVVELLSPEDAVEKVKCIVVEALAQ